MKNPMEPRSRFKRTVFSVMLLPPILAPGINRSATFKLYIYRGSFAFIMEYLCYFRVKKAFKAIFISSVISGITALCSSAGATLDS